MQSLCSEEDEEEESFEQLFSKFRLMKGPNHSYENNFILILILLSILYSNNCTNENLSYFFYRKSRVSTTRPEKEICRKGIDQMCFSNIDLKLNYQLLKKRNNKYIQCTCT